MRRLIALAMPGGPRFVEELQRAWDAGDAVLPVDVRLAPPARRRLLAAMRPAVVVTGISAPGNTGASAGGDEWSLSTEVLGDPLPVEAGDALVMATSGTTGAPKGVVLTHDAVAASARATSARLGVDAEADSWWACLPLSHVGGMSVVTRALVESVACEVVGGFSVEGAAAAIAHGATLTSLVPTALRRLGPETAGRFRRIVLGGSAPPARLAPNVVTTYGLTETGSGIAYDGLPLEGVELKTEAGQLFVRGPMLLRAYRDGQDPKDSSGWLPTGDAGEIAGDGRLVVFGRLGELIITGGENVWPSAVEPVLRRHALVVDAAVAGAADPDWGDRVVAYVTLAGAAGAAGSSRRARSGRGAGGSGQGAARSGRGAARSGRGAARSGRGAARSGRGAARSGRGAARSGRGTAGFGRGAGARATDATGKRGDGAPGPAPAALLAELRELVSSELAAFAAPREIVVVTSIPRTALGKVRRDELASLEGPSAQV